MIAICDRITELWLNLMWFILPIIIEGHAKFHDSNLPASGTKVWG